MRTLALPEGPLQAAPLPARRVWRLDLILVAITVFLSPLNYLRASFG